MSRESSQILKAIANPVRMQILHELGFHDGRARVTDIAQALNLAPNSVSYHLRELANAGVVEKIPTPHGRDARETWYAIRKDELALQVDRSERPAQLPALMDSLYDAMSNSEVIARYRRAALEADDISSERLIASTAILRLTVQEQEELYSSIYQLLTQACEASERNVENLQSGQTSTRTQQIYLALDVFPVVEVSRD